jgi:hypothetical protein
MDEVTRGDAGPAPRRRRGVALLVGIEVLVATAGTIAVVLLSVAGSGAGRTGAPPWSAPADVEGRAAAAGLTMLGSEGVAMHLHEHLSITVDGRAVTVPAHIGIDAAADRFSPIHTHDTTGILHVESPVVRTFHLGQAFTEWDVALGTGRIGAFRNGRDGVREAVFVDRRPYSRDPAGIALAERQDIDFVVTTDGSAPTAPAAAFRFPANY